MRGGGKQGEWYTEMVYRIGTQRVTLEAPRATPPPKPKPGMFCLDQLTLREIRLALKEPFRISSGIEHERRILLLELTDRDRASVWSECVALPQPNYSPETIDTAWLAIREWLAPCLLGRAFTAAAEVHAVLEENVRGHNMAKAALERRRGSHTPWPSTSSGIAASAALPPRSTVRATCRHR